MRDNIVAIAAATARSDGERAREQGLDDDAVIRATMLGAKNNFLAPDENEAFAASLSALCDVLPERKDAILKEARAIGDRSKMLNALMNGVPVDMDAWEPTPFPEPNLDLLGTWRSL